MRKSLASKIYSILKLIPFMDLYVVLIQNALHITSLTRLSPGLSLVRRKKSISMELSLPALYKVWFKFDRYDNTRKTTQLRTWFTSGIIQLCKITNTTTTYKITTNSTMFSGLERIIKKHKLPIEIRVVRNFNQSQKLERLSLIGFHTYGILLIQSVIGNEKAKEMVNSWSKELEMVDLEITVYKEEN